MWTANVTYLLYLRLHSPATVAHLGTRPHRPTKRTLGSCRSVTQKSRHYLRAASIFAVSETRQASATETGGRCPRWPSVDNEGMCNSGNGSVLAFIYERNYERYKYYSRFVLKSAPSHCSSSSFGFLGGEHPAIAEKGGHSPLKSSNRLVAQQPLADKNLATNCTPQCSSTCVSHR